MSQARWGDPREYDARDPGYEWPRVYDPLDRDEHSSTSPCSLYRRAANLTEYTKMPAADKHSTTGRC